MSPTRTARIARQLKMTSATRPTDDVLIVDPSYMAYPSILSSTRVYVDSTGQEHDPDYRLFPIIQPGAARKRRANAARGTGRPLMSQRGFPNYESDDESDDVEDPFNSNRRTSTSNYYYTTPMAASSSLSSTSNTSSSSSSPRSPTPEERAARAKARIAHFSHQTTTPPPPQPSTRTSTSSRSSPVVWRTRDTSFSTEEDHDDDVPSPSRWRRPFTRSRRSSIEEEAEVDAMVLSENQWSYDYRPNESIEASPRRRLRKRSPVMEDDEESLADADNSAPEDAERQDDEWVPTCTDSIRKRWHIISNRVRFATYHTKQRIRSKTGL